MTPPAAGRQERRAGREKIKRAQRQLTHSVSSSLCWYCAGTGVVVDIGHTLAAHVSGIRRCGSPWACLLCAPIIRERRAQEIDTAVSGHLERGGGAEFVTFTLRHHMGDALAPRLGTVTAALALTLTGSPWAKRKRALGYVGAIRAVEITDGDNGWHPHTHTLLLFDRPLTEDERRDLWWWLLNRWGGVVTKRGFGTITGNGVDVRPVRSTADLGSYLCKIDGGWGVGLELSRSDLKGNSPIRHLREFAETGCADSARRWLEYEDATYGKRALRWSPGLRARLLGQETETSDQELAASEGLDLALVRAVVCRETWDGALRAGEATALLTELEGVAAALIAMSKTFGAEPQPLDTPTGRDHANTPL